MEGVLGKNAILFLPPSAWNRGEGEGLCAGQSRRPGARRRPGTGGKGRGWGGDSIPGLTLCRGGAWRSGHGGQQRRVEALAAAALLAEERGLGLAVWLVVVGVVLGGALYSRGKAVGRAERVGWPAGQLTAINGVRSGASGEAGRDVSGSGMQRRGGASGEAATG